MSSGKASQKMNIQVYEEASDWVVQHREGDMDESQKRAFDTWLRRSPDHVQAYLEMSSLWEDMSSLDPKENSGAAELIARARGPENVVVLGSSGVSQLPNRAATSSSITAPRDRRMAFRLLMAACIAIVCVGAVLTWLVRDPAYATGVGEQRSIPLADGSSIDLNARSKIRIHFSEREREVELLEGQALFRVAKDTTRPFIVRSDGTAVQAVGTQFDVYKKATGTVVTVVEGRVVVLDTLAADGPAVGQQPGNVDPAGPVSSSAAHASTITAEGGAIFVSAGEQLAVKPKTVAHPTPANVSAATAWTQHRLVFEGAPLPDVADEFNRYNTKPLVVADPSLATYHVSGVFSSRDPDLLLRFLRSQPDISVTESDTDIRIVKHGGVATH